MNASLEPAPVCDALLCYHCGEKVPKGCDLTVLVEGEEQPMCCPGCQAVALMITGSGLDAFYRQRTAYSDRPREQAQLREAFRVYDDPEVAARFCSVNDDGSVAATLLMGGLNCAACTWLVEHSFAALSGVEQAVVNLSQARLELRFDPQQIALSDIFGHLEHLGYPPRPFLASERRSMLAREYRDDLRRLAVAGLGMMQVGMFAIALHAGDIQGMEQRFESLLRWVSLPVAAFVVLYSARPFFVTAWRHLRQRSLVMDLPVALAIGLAFLASVWATLSGGGQVYFDSVVMFTFFLLLGRFLEKRARHRHAEPWLDIEENLPTAVTVYRDNNWSTTPRIHLCSGDVILVRAGEIVPADAVVTEGDSAVREDSFNGEHLPRDISPGDTIYTGTVNVSANLQARVLGSYRDSRLAALQRSVDNAQEKRPALARLADRIAAYFVATILLIATLTAASWLYIDADRALWVTLSVLVISCPCALALATPAALTSAAAALRRSAVLVRSEDALEALAQCGRIIFDKTGTLTQGRLSVISVVELGNTEAGDILAVAAALQQHSNHPVAAALAQVAPARGFARATLQVGAGVEANGPGGQWRMGSRAWCMEFAPDLPLPPAEPLLWVALCRDDTPIAWIGLSDTLRPDAATVVQDVSKRGLLPELLSGDSSPRAMQIAAQLGMQEARNGASPQQKMQRVQDLQSRGEKVCMVGDGLNDAPVLAQADASFAVAGATDLARTQADFVITDGGLDKIPQTLRLARRTRRVIRQNLTWALAYNACAIPLAAMGLVPPWVAALGMSFSSLLVVGNSLRLNS